MITSESIADYSQRPLYSLGEIECRRTQEGLQHSLNTALARASKWGAVVLMDEADVFMQERSVNEYFRNEQVSGKYFKFSTRGRTDFPQSCYVSWNISKALCF